MLRQELLPRFVAAHLKISLSEAPSNLAVAWIQLACLLEVGERSVPPVLALINPSPDHHRFRIIRQRAASDSQFLKCLVEITGVKVRVVVITSQFQMSLPQIWTHSRRGLR